MKIRALKAFTMRNSDTGELFSVACSGITDVSSELGESLIADGLAEAYTLISPTGSTTISENGTFDVTQYASASVNVATVTLTYDVNGGVGSIDPATVIAGNTLNLNDGSTLTAPEGKEFSGWATSSDATEPNAVSPYKLSANTTLYAVWADIGE